MLAFISTDLLRYIPSESVLTWIVAFGTLIVTWWSVYKLDLWKRVAVLFRRRKEKREALDDYVGLHTKLDAIVHQVFPNSGKSLFDVTKQTSEQVGLLIGKVDVIDARSQARDSESRAYFKLSREGTAQWLYQRS